ncbi:MAG TPA: hypothetical protein VL337_10810, partial [Acidimicrobiales bacterium]|nr:hypothetical protein [Acidimicrobiales bacterium]
VLAALALIASAACSPSSADKATSDPTIATEPAPTTTTNPNAVPAVIDNAYVNRVLAGLDAVDGDVTRLVVKTKTIPREAYDRLRSIYADDKTLQTAIDLIQVYLRGDLSGFNKEPGNQATTVNQLITSKASCIFARVHRDYSAVGPGGSAPSDRTFIAVKRLDNSRDVSGYNQTGWAIAYEGFLPDNSQPPDPCLN